MDKKQRDFLRRGTRYQKPAYVFQWKHLRRFRHWDGCSRHWLRTTIDCPGQLILLLVSRVLTLHEIRGTEIQEMDHGKRIDVELEVFRGLTHSLKIVIHCFFHGYNILGKIKRVVPSTRSDHRAGPIRCFSSRVFQQQYMVVVTWPRPAARIFALSSWLAIKTSLLCIHS